MVPIEDQGIVRERGPDLDLGPDLPGYVLRTNLATFAPGGVRAAHDHRHNPEISYVLHGTITEFRLGGYVQEFGPGAMPAFGRDADHWLENRGTEPAKLVVASVVKRT